MINPEMTSTDTTELKMILRYQSMLMDMSKNSDKYADIRDTDQSEMPVLSEIRSLESNQLRSESLKDCSNQ